MIMQRRGYPALYHVSTSPACLHHWCIRLFLFQVTVAEATWYRGNNPYGTSIKQQQHQQQQQKMQEQQERQKQQQQQHRSLHGIKEIVSTGGYRMESGEHFIVWLLLIVRSTDFQTKQKAPDFFDTRYIWTGAGSGLGIVSRESKVVFRAFCEISLPITLEPHAGHTKFPDYYTLSPTYCFMRVVTAHSKTTQ